MSVISDIQLDSVDGLTCFPHAPAGLTPHTGDLRGSLSVALWQNTEKQMSCLHPLGCEPPATECWDQMQRFWLKILRETSAGFCIFVIVMGFQRYGFLDRCFERQLFIIWHSDSALQYQMHAATESFAALCLMFVPCAVTLLEVFCGF